MINGAFLEKYYVTKKIDVLLNLRTTLENTDIDKMMNSNSSKGMESIPDEIQRACSRNNLSWVIIDSSNTSWLSWGENEKMLQSKLFGYVYDLDEDGDKSRTLKQGDIIPSSSRMTVLREWIMWNAGDSWMMNIILS